MHAQKLKWFDILNEKSGETQEIGSPLLFLMNKNLRPIPHNSSKTPSQLEPQDVHHSNQLNYAPTRFYCLLSLLGIPYYNKPLPTQCAPALLSEENADVLTCTKYLAETHANPHKSSPPRFYTVIMLYRFDLLLNLVPIQTIHRFKGAHKSCYNKASKLGGGGASNNWNKFSSSSKQSEVWDQDVKAALLPVGPWGESFLVSGFWDSWQPLAFLGLHLSLQHSAFSFTRLPLQVFTYVCVQMRPLLLITDYIPPGWPHLNLTICECSVSWGECSHWGEKAHSRKCLFKSKLWVPFDMGSWFFPEIPVKN